MPILSYFLVTGAVLLSLLFAASAMLPQRPEMPIDKIAQESKPSAPARTARIREPSTDTQILSQEAAPEPDMSSELVRLAQPPGTPTAAQPIATVEQPVKTAPKQDLAHKVTKPRRPVAHRDDYRHSYARASRDEYRQAFGFQRQRDNRWSPWGEQSFGTRF